MLKDWYSEHSYTHPLDLQLTPIVCALLISIHPATIDQSHGNIQPLHTSGTWSPWRPLLAFLVLFLISGACGRGTQAKVPEQTAQLFQAVPSYSVPQSAVSLMSGFPHSRHCALQTHSRDPFQRFQEVRAATPQAQQGPVLAVLGSQTPKREQPPGKPVSGPQGFSVHLFWRKTSKSPNASRSHPSSGGRTEGGRETESQPHSLCFYTDVPAGHTRSVPSSYKCWRLFVARRLSPHLLRSSPLPRPAWAPPPPLTWTTAMSPHLLVLS